MTRFALGLVAFLLCAAGPATAQTDADADAASDGWEAGKVGEADGFSYQIFAKAGDGPIVYQARGSIAAEPDVLIRAVRTIASDPDRAPEGQSRRLVARDEAGFTVYTRIDLPTFFSDRDIVTYGVAKVDEETGHHRIDWKAIDHPEAPVAEDTIRIVDSAGFWDFVSDGNGASTAVYETYVDLGGSLPRWLVDPMMGGMVGTTFEDVAREALGK